MGNIKKKKKMAKKLTVNVPKELTEKQVNAHIRRKEDIYSHLWS